MEKIKKGFKIIGGLVLFLALILIIVPGCNKRRELARKNTPPSPIVNPVAAKPEPPSIDKKDTVVVGRSSSRKFIIPPDHHRKSFRFETHNPQTWMLMWRDGDTNTMVTYPGTGSPYGPGIIGGENGIPCRFVELMVHPNSPNRVSTEDTDIWFVEAMNR